MSHSRSFFQVYTCCQLEAPSLCTEQKALAYKHNILGTHCAITDEYDVQIGNSAKCKTKGLHEVHRIIHNINVKSLPACQQNDGT